MDQWIPEAQALSATKVRKLEDPFRYQTLIRTVRELIDTNSPDFLLKIIPNYSELSGFVHGGPTARTKLDLIHAEGLTASELCHLIRFVSVHALLGTSLVSPACLRCTPRI